MTDIQINPDAAKHGNIQKPGHKLKADMPAKLFFPALSSVGSTHIPGDF